MDDDVVTAAIIVIGDEILSGRTKDMNINHIAEHLTGIGIELKEVRIVPDNELEIVTAVNFLRAKFSYVFTTGGIGPTHDDITADAIAVAFGVGIDVDQRALDLMKPFYDARKLELTPSRLRMARLPDGAQLIANKVSIAPGFMMENVIAMAGVPVVMHAMLEAATGRLRKGGKMLSNTIDLDRPESEIAQLLGDLQKSYDDVAMGSYPSFADGKLSTQLVLRSTNGTRLAASVAELSAVLKEKGLL